MSKTPEELAEESQFKIEEAGFGTCPFCKKDVPLSYRRGTYSGLPFTEVAYVCLSCSCVGTYHGKINPQDNNSME